MSTPVTICRKVFTDKIGEKALCSIIDRTVIIPEGITEEAKTKAFVSNGVLYIESNEDITTVAIYDTMSREVLTSSPSPVERGVEITLPNIKGVLIVKVNNDDIKVIN